MVETAVERGLSQPDLWERIRTAPLPRGFIEKSRWADARDVTFTDRLQKSYNLTEKSAVRLVAEYRRYLYLKTLDGGLLSPSV
jgi:hypothetical protein